MRITRLGGVTSVNDTSITAPDKVEAIFQAQAAFTSGMCVAHTGLASVNTIGTLVIKTGITSALDHLFVGIYEGNGNPTGAAASVTGASGKDASAGDIVLVTCYGVAQAQFDATTTTVTPLDLVAPSLVTAGLVIDGGSTLTAGLFAPMIALDTLSATSTVTVKPVFVKCM